MKVHWKRKRNANPVDVNHIMNPLARELGIEPLLLLYTLQKNWESIVGATNARNTHPLRIENGRLAVGVSSPAWITQARFYAATFLEKINRFDERAQSLVQEITFKLG